MNMALRAIPTSNTSDVWEERKSYVPDNFKFEGAIKIKTAGSDLDADEPSVPEKPSNLPLFAINVGGSTYRLVRPISVRIYRDQEWVFAENETLNLIGTGSNLLEAVNDLQEHIIHFWNYYSQIPDESLTIDALQLKRIYSERLILR